MNYCVFGASSNQLEEKYLRAGFRLGECLAGRGHGIVFGGGNSGLMGAVARGVRAAGGAEIVGIVPSFFNVDGILYPDCTELLYTETMRERKRLMEERAAGFIITPGGIGTMDEFFETLTLRSLRRHEKPLAVLNTDGYYDSLAAMLDRMVEEHFLEEEARALCPFFAEPEELAAWIAGATERRE